jgi:hypothetical protein
MAKQRKRVKHTATFEERLVEEAIKFKEAAEKQPPGSIARKLLLRRARQAETASQINNWLRSPGLHPPKVASNERAISQLRVTPPQLATSAILRHIKGSIEYS